MSNRDWLLIFVYLYIIGVYCQQVYRSLKLTYISNILSASYVFRKKDAKTFKTLEALRNT